MYRTFLFFLAVLLVTLFGVTEVKTVQAQDATPEATPEATSTPVPACSDLPDAGLTIGGYGASTPGGSALNMRKQPIKDNADSAVGKLGNGEAFYVLDGPVCNHWWWWKIRKANGLEGWVTAGDQDGPYLEALPGKPADFDQITGCPYGPLTKLEVGAKVSVNSDEVAVYEGPSLDYPQISTVNKGDTLEIIGGFTCRRNGTWWMLQSADKTITGWTLEASDTETHLQPAA